jgi:hypothetical protein
MVVLAWPCLSHSLSFTIEYIACPNQYVRSRSYSYSACDCLLYITTIAAAGVNKRGLACPCCCAEEDVTNRNRAKRPKSRKTRPLPEVAESKADDAEDDAEAGRRRQRPRRRCRDPILKRDDAREETIVWVCSGWWVQLETVEAAFWL